jgi:hypothetical protein
MEEYKSPDPYNFFGDGTKKGNGFLKKMAVVVFFKTLLIWQAKNGI